MSTSRTLPITALSILAGGVIACSSDDASTDAGAPAADAATPADAAAPDAGEADAGAVDAGETDTGVAPDAGLEPVPADGPFTFMTWNVGLIEGGVAIKEARMPTVIQGLKDTRAHVVCVNELWTEEDYETVRDELSEIYPFSFRMGPAGSSTVTPECAAGDTLQLQLCVGGCDAMGISVAECVATTCSTQYDVLNDDCKRCLSANTADPNGCVFGGATDFIFDGSNALALFSRYPIEDPGYTELFAPFLAKRGVITATIGATVVQCTHLSSDLGIVPYPPNQPTASYAEENLDQVAVLGTLRAPGRCNVLLGDTNSSPMMGEINATLPDSWQALLDLGFETGWTTPQCTFCEENPLTSGGTDEWIDHVLFDGCETTFSGYAYERVLDDPITVDVDGDAVETRRSDHYGLRVTATAP